MHENDYILWACIEIDIPLLFSVHKDTRHEIKLLWPMVVDLYMFFEINYNEYAERKEEEENYE
jgi:hypothetical protein